MPVTGVSQIVSISTDPAGNGRTRIATGLLFLKSDVAVNSTGPKSKQTIL